MTNSSFFALERPVTTSQIVALVGSSLENEGEVLIDKFSNLEDAQIGSLTFATGLKNKALLSSTNASVVLVDESLSAFVPAGTIAIHCSYPQNVFASLLREFFPQAWTPTPFLGHKGISPRAFVDDSAVIEDDVTIEAGSVVGQGASIGRGSVIGPNAMIGSNCQIGRNCLIGPGSNIQASFIGNNVRVLASAQIGQDGFGFVPGNSGLEKIPQIGRVIIQDNVEIGANTSIDRGALGDTVIGEGTKIDNLVQIAHNVNIGRFCAIAAHCGISGSVTIGDFVMLGGLVGIADHRNIGSGAQVAATSGVMNDIPAGEKWGGIPAMPIKAFFRQHTALKKLGQQTRK